MATTIEILGRLSTAKVLEAMRAVTTAYAEVVRDRLAEDRPPPPARGAMKFVSDRQRKFVMANIRQGKITVPYVRGRGNGLKGSQTLNRSFRVDLQGDAALLTSSASYAPYVIGDQQAPIHRGRWTTAKQAAESVKQRGDIVYIVKKVMEAL